MQLRALRYFVTLAREGHFARAAEACGVTQPTLSSALAALEDQLGKRLVERDRRFIGLTEEGRAMLPWAQQLLAAHEGMVHAVEALDGPLHGEFRLGVIPAATPSVGAFAEALLRLHPGMTISVRSQTSREIVRAIEAYEIDAGITYLDHESPANVISVPLYAERYVFVTAAAGRRPAPGAVTWEQVEGYPFCLLHQGMQNRRILDTLMSGQGVSVRPRATADGYVALLAIVRSGGLATVMPERYVGLIEGADWASVHPLTMDAAVSRIGVIVGDRAPLDPVANAALGCARSIAGLTGV
ncbi:LysR family transcriptional regulator [Novosphingobium pentaromativorans]|uniref:LysR family transcriptional regulator n=1 Tax=Novosphingobium pentaromativorans US6-1 TaxID=1088721 RepID=G6E789_9SPHN|nr:LysR family transcriptional regulator [Novosphingobium pentaromativorans]AIT81703.1 LysR family transcriptional regulator [Novosphingobium pentaromativorans US6-1]EHJ62712.1 LysR family transcriptional regulator [Novosphingobium pentaromativorans US6-1]